MAKYRVLVGIDYPPDRRAEAGDEVADLPAQSVKWLLELGAIEAMGGAKKAPTEATEAPTSDEEAE